jgi:hypothetical protein
MKNQTPIAMWGNILNVLSKNAHLFVFKQTDNLALHLVDVEPGSHFFFSCNMENENGKYEISYAPASELSVRPVKVTVDAEHLYKSVVKWVNILEQYSKIDLSKFTIEAKENPVEKAYEDSFFTILKELQTDTDSDTVSFDVFTQLRIDKYISEIIVRLPNYMENASETEVKEIEAIRLECQELRKTITKKTKTEILKKIARIWAKGFSFGLDLGKEMLRDFAKSSILNLGQNLIDSII